MTYMTLTPLQLSLYIIDTNLYGIKLMKQTVSRMSIISESTRRLNISALPLDFHPNNVIKLLEKRGIPHEACEGIKKFVDAAISLMQEDLLLTKKERLDPAEWKLDFILIDSAKFDAFTCSPSMGNYQIYMSVGAIVMLLSFACELATPVEKGVKKAAGVKQLLQRSIRFCFGRNNCLYDWTYLNDFDNETKPAAATLAKDAALLLFHHELAHVLFGHHGVHNPAPAVRRALEADADFNAGTMFAARLIREKVGLRLIEKRLTDASLLIGILFKAISAKTDLYHFPTIRSVTYLAGGAFILERFFPLPVPHLESVRYWERERSKHEAMFVEQLRGKSLEKFIGTEAKIANDMEALKNITLPLRDEYKDDFLCSVVDAMKAQSQAGA